jgi:hypothetical protein
LDVGKVAHNCDKLGLFGNFEASNSIPAVWSVIGQAFHHSLKLFERRCVFGMLPHRIDRAIYCSLIMAVSISPVGDDRCLAIAGLRKMDWGEAIALWLWLRLLK